MSPQNDEAAARLEADWPDWQAWVVYRVIGAPVWCARRRDDHRTVLNASSPDELAAMIEAAVSGDVPGPR